VVKEEEVKGKRKKESGPEEGSYEYPFSKLHGVASQKAAALISCSRL
jgi:hypothetical protein